VLTLVVAVSCNLIGTSDRVHRRGERRAASNGGTALSNRPRPRLCSCSVVITCAEGPPGWTATSSTTRCAPSPPSTQVAAGQRDLGTVEETVALAALITVPLGVARMHLRVGYARAAGLAIRFSPDVMTGISASRGRSVQPSLWVLIVSQPHVQRQRPVLIGFAAAWPGHPMLHTVNRAPRRCCAG